MQILAIPAIAIIAVSGFFVTKIGQTTVQNNDESNIVQTAANAPARDGNIAIRQEYDAAVLANTVAAFELFIARHPDHPLTELAVAKLAELQAMDN